MSKQVISVGYGKGSFATRSFGLSGFVVGENFARTVPNKVYKRQGQTQRFPCSEHPEVNGYTYLDTVEADDGAIILLQSSHRNSMGPIADACVFIRLRTTGPMLAIRAILHPTVDSTIDSEFLVFQGRGDVLENAELAENGVDPWHQWARSFLDEEERRECYNITEVAPGSARRMQVDVVETTDGESVRIPKATGRRVRLR